METMCKWVTVGIMLFVFVGLMSLAGSVHLVEYLGSIVIAMMAARFFYIGICKDHSDHLAQQK